MIGREALLVSDDDDNERREIKRLKGRTKTVTSRDQEGLLQGGQGPGGRLTVAGSADNGAQLGQA
jgi:hypothetical protein